MNYNYEINYNNQKKNQDNSKYIHSTNDSDNQTFIFELILKDKLNNIKIIRRMKKNNQGNILSSDDNILYNFIDKYKLTIININNPENPIIIKENINHLITTNTYINNDIYLEINQNNNKFMDINYYISLQ